jgi:putative endonuclease
LQGKKIGEISPSAFSGEANPPSSFIMYYVYILLNEAKSRTYTGVTDDVNKRLAEHNAGKVKSSQPYRPYKVIHIESFETLKEARQKEKYYKSTSGRRRLREMLCEA